MRDENGRYIPGCSGNPGGRPKAAISLTSILREKAEEIPEGEFRKRLELLALKLWDMALAGFFPAVEYIYDRVDGRPMATVNVNSALDEEWLRYLQAVDPREIELDEIPYIPTEQKCTQELTDGH